MTWLVTGGAGFIGSHVVRALLDLGESVTVVDSLNEANRLARFEHPKLTKIVGNINNTKLYREHVTSCSRVLHLAAFAKPSRAEVNVAECYDSNLFGTIALVNVCREIGVKSVVATSAGALYAPSRDSYTELSPIDPFAGVYAMSKRLMEHVLHDANTQFGLNTRVIRLFNTYGPGQDSEYLIPSLLKKAVDGNFEIYNGSVARDFNYISDVVDLLLKVANYSGPTRLFNCGTGSVTSVQRIAEMLGERYGVLFRDLKQTTFGPVYQRVDSSLARSELGWVPSVDIEKGLEEVCKDYDEKL